MNADRLRSVPIGECTLDNWVCVRRKSVTRQTHTIPYVIGGVAVTARPLPLPPGPDTGFVQGRTAMVELIRACDWSRLAASGSDRRGGLGLIARRNARDQSAGRSIGPFLRQDFCLLRKVPALVVTGHTGVGC